MKKFAFLILSGLCLLGGKAMAQATGHIEFSVRDNYEDEWVLSAGAKGLIVQSSSKDDDGTSLWMKQEYYSTDLKLTGADSVKVPRKARREDWLEADGKIYTFARGKDDSFVVTESDPVARTTRAITSTFDHKSSARLYTVGGGKLVFANTEKKTEKINIMDLQSGTVKTLDVHFDGVKDKNVYVFALSIINSNIMAFVSVEGYTWLLRTDMEGNQLSRTQIIPDEPEVITSAGICKSGALTFLTGTYTKSKSGRANGIYMAALDGDNLSFFKSYNFLDLKNFTEFMSEKQQKKVERRKAKAEKAGKEYNVDYRIVSHDIEYDGQNYYYLGEAFYPTYITYRQGNVIITDFNGYQYTHAVLVKFDPKGNMIWDTCFPMWPKNKPMRAVQLAALGKQGSNVSLVYADRDKLVSKVVDSSTGAEVQGKETDMIQTGDDNEDVKKMKSSTVLHWWDNNFIVFGRQYIKNKDTGDRRKVFGITKYTLK